MLTDTSVWGQALSQALGLKDMFVILKELVLQWERNHVLRRLKYCVINALIWTHLWLCEQRTGPNEIHFGKNGTLLVQITGCLQENLAPGIVGPKFK